MKREIVEGKLQGNENGYAFLLNPKGNGEDYFIPHSDLRGAMHGDLVLCETTDGVGQRTTARVLKILSRGISQIVGTYFTCKSGGFVVSDDRKYFCDIFIPFGKGLRCRAGDKVVCKILTYPKKKNPEGIVTKILGRQFEKNAELTSIAWAYNLNDKFPKNVISESENLISFSSNDIGNRSDLRSVLTFTIDGEDARDFDDAVSIELQGDNYLLGVHIADVSYYVKEKSAIDNEAFNRGTSVYFPEKVFPMLPERLCNDLCSLKEGVVRPTLSCIMTIDKNGKILDKEIVESVIKSSARLTYTEVEEIYSGNVDIIKKRKNLGDSLILMKELSQILYKRREKNGSIDLDVKESAIIVDKNGKINVSYAKKDNSHKLIEEFMILANVCVAEFIYYLQLPFIYRIHEKPNEEKLENFYTFLSLLGVKVKRHKDGVYPLDFQTILKNTKDLPISQLVNRVMLRSMQKAKYSPQPLNHFGLAEEHYCHFTSPIRRYPDLVVHRIIKELLHNGLIEQQKYTDFVVKASALSSEKEKNAETAERAVDDYYKMLYIENFIGEQFDGIISGVTNFGIFVEIDGGIEGLCKIENLKGKNYKFDSKSLTLFNAKNKYKFGDSVKILVAGVNIIERKAEFLIVDK